MSAVDPSAFHESIESLSAPGLFFAGNITAGSRGIRKHGVGPNSTSVNGFRYNARVLAEHLAERLGIERPRPRLERDDLVPFLLRELSRAPELWIQKGYLCRIVNRAEDGMRDDGILPLQICVDEATLYVDGLVQGGQRPQANYVPPAFKK